MRKLILVFVGCAMAFCLWPNQAAAVAGGYGGGRVESPSGGNPSNGFSPSGDGSRSYVHHNETGTSNTTPLEGLISTVFFVLFGGTMIWQRRRRNQPVDEGAFQEMWAALPGTSKEKKALLKEIQQTFLEIQQAWDQENLSVVKDNYTEKLYQKHLVVLQANQQVGIRNHVKKVKVAPASNYHHISETSFSLMLHFSCIDYEEDTQSGRVLSGYKHQKQYFSQLWYFDYNPSLGKWQADFIQPKG